MNRIRRLVCGHPGVRVLDYGDDYRWLVGCSECAGTESWTEREVRDRLTPHPPPLDLLVIDAEPVLDELGPVC